MRGERWQLPGFGVAAFSFALTSSALEAAAMCAERSISLQTAYVHNPSDWQEFDSSGKMIVHESGSLTGAELSAGLACGRWDFQALVAELGGHRKYEGQTSSGMQVTSQSALRQNRAMVQAGFHLDDAWLLGVRWSGQTSWREIASAGGAAGYPERFDWTLLSMGAQWKTSLGSSQIYFGIWSGRQLTSSMELNLPGRDQAMLNLGPVHQLELALGWRMPFDPGWSLQMDASYRRTIMEEGTDTVIRRNGLPAGIAHQPRTQSLDTPLAIRISYDF